jgi:hypothetical protein
MLWGENREETTIKLADGLQGFQDPAAPKTLIYTASDLYTESPTGGGRDYDNLGEGNEAFANYVEHLTVDSGNNPGAIAVDYLGNNYGAVRDVSIEGNGPIGLNMTRKWPGPALITNVSINGFGYGIKTKHRQLGLTFEHITLWGQSTASILNEDNVL